ncbi:IS4 family transposase [Ectobacillus antri]|uniref:IS4 family transposase n=2 Tax=Ectobacillus antri TaxID=2486280 RepID=A0ABT6H896_9BACI|nr:IS4 family transposase [Ectobacillus antri]MDG4658549.1 IS4 family transposase [Ectobacillus antri]MDG5755549.1 IS4 family transposase [Ectobacillus antri]
MSQPHFMSTKECAQTDELRLLGEEFQNIFSLTYLQELACKTGMIQRQRKVRAQDLVSLCVFLGQTVGSESLVDLCTRLNEAMGVCISTEALNKRWNERTVQFLKELFLHAFGQQIHPIAPLTRIFKRIRILDSTSFQLPSAYADTYRGSGGGGSEAGVKIQLEYDLLSGEFLALEVGHGVSNDAKYGQFRTETVEEGDLILRDLGYHYIKDLDKMTANKAYYISRLRWNTQVYQKDKQGNWVLLHIEELTKHLKEGETIELPNVYIGYEHRHPTRLVLYRLTQNEWNKRLSHHKKMNKKMPKAASKVNLLVTNISPEKLPATEIYHFYSLRWQIEILFKTWKSIFNIHTTKRMKLERFQCHLYGQLLRLCLVARITYQMRKLLWEKKGKEASEMKCAHMVQIYLTKVHAVLFCTFQHPVSVLTRLFQDVSKNGKKARRYQKATPFEILRLIEIETAQLPIVA